MSNEMHRLLTADGEFNRKAIHARAASLHQAAIARGDKGAEATFEYWSSYVWRVARGQHEAAAPLRMEAMARALTNAHGE
jgi:hypothetical protein